MGMDNVPRCQHVKVNGTQCGSPALRWHRLCFFHNNVRGARAKILADTSAPRMFDLPLLEDANSVQMALMKVIQMLGSGRMDHRTAGLMLYALQTATSNLRNTDFEADEVTDVVIVREDVQRTDIGGPQWDEDDFEDPEEEDADETENEIEDEEDAEDDEEDVAAAPAQTESVARKVAKVKHVTLEEARMQVRGVVQNWLLESAGGKAEVNPG
jgi:hypothetical protein